MASSLFLVGEIGVNDYLVALGSNTTVREVRTFVPHIVTAVRSVLQQVIAAGARTVLVPGMIPLGCEPQLLALYKSKSGGYDPESGCITCWGLQHAAPLLLPRAHTRTMEREGYLVPATLRTSFSSLYSPYLKAKHDTWP
jgi:hypothetical protein